MNTNDDGAKVDRLDGAIDQVAARMVAVRDNPEIMMRIVSALPERSSRLGWLMPRLAALSAIAIAAVVWSTRERPAVAPLSSSAEIATVAAFPGGIAAREPGIPREPGTVVRTMPSKPLGATELLSSGSDFDRSLPALEALNALELAVIEPRELPATETLTLAPIDIGELPLTAETISPDKF